MFDNEADFKRLDFMLSEVSSTAAWVKEAFAQNERKRKVMAFADALSVTASSKEQGSLIESAGHDAMASFHDMLS